MPILAAKESEGEEGGWAEPERDGQECNPGPIVVEYYHRRGDRLAPSPNPGQNEWKDQAAIESQRNEGRLLEVNGNMQVFRSKLGTQLYLEHSRRHRQVSNVRHQKKMIVEPSADSSLDSAQPGCCWCQNRKYCCFVIIFLLCFIALICVAVYFGQKR
ncbi:uncharacterized protein [Drosophila pseudoobscura]|uniref:Uncharacterized protein isoform X3 n=1 Tax=Drosophila pseudoobscura pseudoobscura TaxID=46245 RepID=A0A6I8VQ44_DROPS|nr:uncharacterized protein LOC26533523 isoform X3 [Drosophila pseudoobscura]